MTKKILQRRISGFKSFKGRWLTVATGYFESVRFADLGEAHALVLIVAVGEF